MSESPSTVEPTRPQDFIREIVADDLKEGRHGRRVNTRFPPEPNGYLHIGHAKSICLNFGVAEEFGGLCNLRFDDTNPTKEDVEYVDSIQEDVRWLGFDWDDRMFYASDYFEQMYRYAEQLITDGKAYIDSLTADQIREYRGSLTSPGRNSPFRERSVEENLDLFRRMRAAEFPDGAHVLRAKIDMASPNINMRDPTLYRIRHATHHRTQDVWCIYPTYDYAHPISDAIEGITHSLCTLEFEDHRPLYDWVVDNLGRDGGFRSRPQQIEFARLNLNYTVMSKRKLLALVEQGLVRGWNDPRMPTIAGLRRRGFTPEAVRDFCTRIGVAKKDRLLTGAGPFQLLFVDDRRHEAAGAQPGGSANDLSDDAPLDLLDRLLFRDDGVCCLPTAHSLELHVADGAIPGHGGHDLRVHRTYVTVGGGAARGVVVPLRKNDARNERSRRAQQQE